MSRQDCGSCAGSTVGSGVGARGDAGGGLAEGELVLEAVTEVPQPASASSSPMSTAAMASAEARRPCRQRCVGSSCSVILVGSFLGTTERVPACCRRALVRAIRYRHCGLQTLRGLLQAAIQAAQIAEAVAVEIQDDDLGNAGELGERLLDLGRDARVGANAGGG